MRAFRRLRRTRAAIFLPFKGHYRSLQYLRILLFRKNGALTIITPEVHLFNSPTSNILYKMFQILRSSDRF